MTGAERIAAERRRQVLEECWDEAHDDAHTDESLAWAAVCYAAPREVYTVDGGGPCITFSDPWPESWDCKWDKRHPMRDPAQALTEQIWRKQRIRELEKAGALIAAEIDRIMRTDPRCSHVNDEGARCTLYKNHPDVEHSTASGPFGTRGAR